MSKKTEQEEIKVILVGEAGTGKTSLINSAIGIEFKDFLPSSATNSFAPKEIKIDGKKYILRNMGYCRTRTISFINKNFHKRFKNSYFCV